MNNAQLAAIWFFISIALITFGMFCLGGETAVLVELFILALLGAGTTFFHYFDKV